MTMNQKVWAEFCDGLKQAGELISSEQSPGDDLTQAEGYRYLTRLLRAGLDSCVEGADPLHPVFYSLSNDTIKIGNDNPDNYYLNANVRGDQQYLIEGEFGEVEYFSIASKAGSYATTGHMLPTGELTSLELKVDENRRFEIIVSSEKPDDDDCNWLPMSPDSDNLIIRQYCNARKERPAQFSIHCTSADTSAALDPDLLGEQLLRAIGFVQGTSSIFAGWINQFQKHTNQLPANDQQMCIRAGGNAGIHYHNSHWQLANDEVLIIQPQRIPVCESWNFQLSNYWMESLDYRYHTITLNDNSAVPDKHGRYKLVVAHQDPGAAYPNWLSTAGHNQGGMLFRWIGAEEYPLINTRVARFSEL